MNYTNICNIDDNVSNILHKIINAFRYNKEIIMKFIDDIYKEKLHVTIISFGIDINGLCCNVSSQYPYNRAPYHGDNYAIGYQYNDILHFYNIIKDLKHSPYFEQAKNIFKILCKKENNNIIDNLSYNYTYYFIDNDIPTKYIELL